MRARVALQKIVLVYGCCLFLWITYLYNYAWFCKWHFKDSKTRLLLIGDPQIQGDARVANSGFYGQVDVWYNDMYFRHISDSLMGALHPSHVFVLGDLFSSQYIGDEEFKQRVERYMWIYKNVNVPFYNIVGNHDIGYGSDIERSRIHRFEAAFGKVDNIIEIEDHLIGIVNSMNLDKSSYEEAWTNAWANLEALKNESEATGRHVIIMKHIPLLKEDFDFSGEHFANLYVTERKRELCAERAASGVDRHGNVKWQNMMSEETTRYILDEIKPIFVFNGHDHDGCIYRHNEQTVEYTVRSVMGDFGGYTALFEILPHHSSDGTTTYEYFYTPCPFVYLSTVTITAVSTLVWFGLLLCFCFVKRRGKTKEH